MWFILLLAGVAASPREVLLATDYFLYKNMKYVSHLTCKGFDNKAMATALINKGMRVAADRINQNFIDLELLLHQRNGALGVLLHSSCPQTQDVLFNVSELMLFDSTHAWLVLSDGCNDTLIDELFADMKLSVDADIAVALNCDDTYRLVDVFNFGRIQGNLLETVQLGAWTPESGLDVWMRGFKYYNRWDFHNLTLRAVSVVTNMSKPFDEKMLWEPTYTKGVVQMTKVSSQLLVVIKEMHNFRYNYTIVDVWVGKPKKNSTPTVTNLLYWREQDISSTTVRMFPQWLDWSDAIFPPAINLETKFYYIIPDKGVGDYENRFLTPMSPGVWWCSVAAGVACALVLTIAAATEGRPEPRSYGVFSVLAAGFQQDYEDGAQTVHAESSSRKLAMLVVGLTSMMLYNYYTSSVVSWLLNAAPPTLASIEGLIKSDLELIFEDAGYTRGWLASPGFYYYNGFKDEKEDELRAKKVFGVKRTVPLMQNVEDGIALVRKGKYAYHTEPYSASQVISRTFDDADLCALGELVMVKPSAAYIMGQKKSPYRQFFVWSMMRLLERGHMKVARARVGGEVPSCSGQTPRALSLGQAAPAFLLLAEVMVLSVLMLTVEVWWHRRTTRKAAKNVPLPLVKKHLH